MKSDFAIYPHQLWQNEQQQCEDAMPTFIRMVAKLEEPAGLLGEGFRAVLLFSGIGLAVALVAVASGVQGVWL
jgi:Flp pilus assembly protein TadB